VSYDVTSTSASTSSSSKRSGNDDGANDDDGGVVTPVVIVTKAGGKKKKQKAPLTAGEQRDKRLKERAVETRRAQKKTKRGQPVMKSLMQNMLGKLQAQKRG
jgi:hypothetical protein